MTIATSPGDTALGNQLSHLSGGECCSSSYVRKSRQTGYGPTLITWQVPEMGFDLGLPYPGSGHFLNFSMLVTEENDPPMFIYATNSHCENQDSSIYCPPTPSGASFWLLTTFLCVGILLFTEKTLPSTDPPSLREPPAFWSSLERMMPRWLAWQ